MNLTGRSAVPAGRNGGNLAWLGIEFPPGRFFEGQNVWRRIAPFIVAGVLPFALLPALHVSFGSWQVIAAAVVVAVVIASALLAPWPRLPGWTQMLPVLSLYIVIALLRDAPGADPVVFEPLVIIPIAWAALYGTRAGLAVATAAMAATMALPVLLVGGPDYDGEQLVRAGIAVVLAATLGSAIQSLVTTARRLATESRAILDTAQDAFVSVDQDGYIIEWNQAAERTFGWTRGEAIGRNVIDTLARPKDRRPSEELLERFLRTGDGPVIRERTELRAIRKDGEVIPIEANVSPVRIDDRWVFNIFMHDITARRRARASLMEAEERFRRAFEDNRVGMVLLNADGEFTRTNMAFCELLGYAPDELVDRGFPEITHPDDVEESMTAVREIVAGRRYGFRTEKRCLHSEGHHVWTAVNVSPIRDEGGELLHLIAQVEDITERKAEEAKLTHQALHDPLTGLPNRILFADRVRMASARRAAGSFAVIYLDLDTFKPINDTLGHAAGDRVLVEVSRRLEHLLREGDTLARLGGDEFAILCEGADRDAARLVADRVIEAFSRPFTIEGRDVEQAASIGVAVQRRDGRPTDPEGILRAADLAMYRAKAGGKSRYAVFEGWMGEGADASGRLEEELRLALDRGELTVHYQPEVDLRTGAVTGAEALVRWQHPERGLLGPAEFIGVAEGSGLIVAIDDFVLWQACQEAARWRRKLRDGEPFVISVNMSERRLAEPGLSNKIAQAISEAGLPVDALCLEVAESAVLDRRGGALAALPDLEELGVRLLIDDFGVAVSSFSVLKRLPRLNAIKIDRSFVAGMGRTPEDSAGVAALIGMAHGLKLSAIAEGVETPEQLSQLRELDCDSAQGFHFARPQPPGSFAGILDSARYGELLA